MFLRLGGRAHIRGVWLPSGNCKGLLGILAISVKTDLLIAYRPRKREWSRLLMLFTFYNQTIRQFSFIIGAKKKTDFDLSSLSFSFSLQKMWCWRGLSLSQFSQRYETLTWLFDNTWQVSWPGKKLSCCCCCSCCRGCRRCSCWSRSPCRCCRCRGIFRSSCCLGESWIQDLAPIKSNLIWRMCDEY